MNLDERKTIYKLLAAPFPEEAIQRTKAEQTKRGYDTTGIGYQFIANRLNEVVGVGGWRVSRAVKAVAGSRGRDNTPCWFATSEVVLQLGEWSGDRFVPYAEVMGDGGHVAATEADAIKGAFTNGFKKTAAFLGVGRQAYEGTLDDDNTPADDKGKQAEPRAAQTGGSSTRTESTAAVFPNYGKAKNQPVAGASMANLRYYAQGCQRSLDNPDKERWHSKERALLAAIEAEIARQEGNGNGHGAAATDAHPPDWDDAPPRNDEDVPF